MNSTDEKGAYSDFVDITEDVFGDPWDTADALKRMGADEVLVNWFAARFAYFREQQVAKNHG